MRAGGCLVEIKQGETTLNEYAYDYERRLIEAKHNGVTVATYRYDGLGRRVLVTFYDELGAPESVTRYLYDGDAVVQEYVVGGGWVLDAEYIHGAGTDNALTITRDSATYYYHYDGLGSVTELTDSTGALAQAYEYDAWGIPTIYDPTSSIGNPYLYTGRRWDTPISLYYYRARHYNPATGRFLQADVVSPRPHRLRRRPQPLHLRLRHPDEADRSDGHGRLGY